MDQDTSALDGQLAELCCPLIPGTGGLAKAESDMLDDLFAKGPAPDAELEREEVCAGADGIWVYLQHDSKDMAVSLQDYIKGTEAVHHLGSWHQARARWREPTQRVAKQMVDGADRLYCLRKRGIGLRVAKRLHHALLDEPIPREAAVRVGRIEGLLPSSLRDRAVMLN